MRSEVSGVDGGVLLVPLHEQRGSLHGRRERLVVGRCWRRGEGKAIKLGDCSPGRGMDGGGGGLREYEEQAREIRRE